MKKFFGKIGNLGKRGKMLVGSAVVALSSMALAVSAFADETTPTASQQISSALTTSFGTMVSDFVSMLSAMLPTALSVVSIGLIISYGVKWFKKISGKA